MLTSGLLYKGEDFAPGEEVVIVSGPRSGMDGTFVKYDSNRMLVVKLADNTVESFNSMSVEASYDYYGDEDEDEDADA